MHHRPSERTRRRKVLLIAFHYPPCGTSSGLQRTLAFSIHLRSLGWQPYVLTVKPQAYEQTSPSQLRDIPADVTVVRTRALDAARHLAVRGRYWSRLAIPDRWTSWWLTAVPAAVSLVRRERIQVIWSTYPIATAHWIASATARLTRRPWVADFRDPLVETHPETGEIFPADSRLRNARLRVEAAAVRGASRLHFCTQGARDIVAGRYSGVRAERLAVIPNGFEEQTFIDAERLPSPAATGRRYLLHSGMIYPGADRDPTQLFDALKGLLDSGAIAADTLEVRLRNPSNTEYFERLALERGVASIVSILPSLPYREALAEMLAADGLLLLQGITSNPAVPAKCYEYLRARRPILALVHPDGETARTLRTAGIEDMASLDDVPGIRALLLRWLAADAASGFGTATRAAVAAYSRGKLAERLAEELDAVCPATDT